MSKEEVYKSNIKILYEDLRNAIDDYVEHGHITGDVRFVNAYLMATIGAIVAYNDTVLREQKDFEEMKACKYANNMLKHNPVIVTCVEAHGGLSFPMSFPFEIPIVDVVWKWQDLCSHHEDQKMAFRELFVGKPVIETLEGILDQIGIEKNL